MRTWVIALLACLACAAPAAAAERVTTVPGARGPGPSKYDTPKALALIHVQAGTLGPSGDWVDGEVSPIQGVAQTDDLKLRPWHRREVDLPLYAVQTDLTGGRVLRGARRSVAGSKVPRSRSVLVDASSDESHLDPRTAAPGRNRFLKTVVPFLRTVR